MKVLVTGASGRVGANLCKQLLEKGHTVRAFIWPGDASRMGKLQGYGVEVRHGDLTNYDHVVEAVNGMEAIYHIGAAMIGPFDNRSYFEINAKGTLNVLEAARTNCPNLQRLIYSSTDAVYPVFPDTEPGKIATEDMPVDPMGAYAFSKWVGEKLVLNYYKQYKMPTVVFRFAWVIGAGEIMDPNYTRMFWLSKTLEQYRARKGSSAEADQCLAVLEGLWKGEERLLVVRSKVGMAQKMHFVDVRDLLQGLFLGLEKPEAIGDMFTLPGPQMLSADKVSPYLSEKLGVPWVEAKLPINMTYRELSWAKTHRVLGYTPQHDLASMVELGLRMRRGEPIDLIPTGMPYGKA